MRIGLDMLAVQSPHHGARGIGRYSANLVSTLLARDDDHEYVLYVHDGLSADRVPDSRRAEVRAIRPEWGLGEAIAPCMDRLVRENADELDAFLVLSPFEKWSHYNAPVKPDNGLKMASVVYDLIPFLRPEERVIDPILMRHYRVLETITRYDALLTISEATRRDCLALLPTPPERIVNISAASDPSAFFPDRSEPTPAVVRESLAKLGINRPFVFNVGGLDPRKNIWTLIEAYAALPESLRKTHQLVLTFHITTGARDEILGVLKTMGLEGDVLVTGELDDPTLLQLYQRCALFAFPSLYEGFGLPILEAMHCGAAVLAGNNSSQVEVVGDAGMLCDASERKDIADKLETMLANPAQLAELRAKAPAHAATFSWDRTADRAMEVLTNLVNRKPRSASLRFHRSHAIKPRIAFFSPLRPKKSGVSDYSGFLLEELRETYTIDLFHDSGYIPEPALAHGEYMCADYRLFDRIAAARDYHALVYQMGNSHYHSYMYPILQRHHGIVALHDFCLSGFHVHYGHAIGRGFGLIREELLKWYPDDSEKILACLEECGADGEALQRACVVNGWYLNHRVLASSQVLVLHSPWGVGQILLKTPKYADRVVVIKHGIHSRKRTPGDKDEVRRKYGLPLDATIIGSFGFIHPDKMCPQAISAFVEIAREEPLALFVLVGEEADGGAVRRHAESLGLMDRIRFLGRQPASAFEELTLAIDVGVNLRLPPTNGETSGSLLNLLAAGVPTIVTDVATFMDYPSSVVYKVHWETEGHAGLVRALRSLVSDQNAREALGRIAWQYTLDNHRLAEIAPKYVEVIERSHQGRLEGRAARHARRRVRLGAPA